MNSGTISSNGSIPSHLTFKTSCNKSRLIISSASFCFTDSWFSSIGACLVTKAGYMTRLSACQPLNSFIMSILNLTFCLICAIIPYASTMLFIIFKFSDISVTVSHLLCSFTFNFPIYKATFIPGLIGPNHHPIFIVH